jgi:hypothetical protein
MTGSRIWLAPGSPHDGGLRLPVPEDCTLQELKRPSWEYTGRNDDMRPSTTDLDMKMVSRVLLLKCGFKATKELIDFPAGIGCYYLSSEARREVLRRMPALQDIGLSMQHSTIGDWWIYEGQNAGR